MKLSRAVRRPNGRIAFIYKSVAGILIYTLVGLQTVALAAAPPALPSHAEMIPLSPQDLLDEALLYFMKQKMGNVLPLQLDPSQALPTVPNAQLPGGPFHGQRLAITADNVSKPLPPGDYEVPVMAYCTQYSVHRPGRGAAAVLAPLTGTQASVIGNLLWKGTQAGKRPQELQTTAWAIQAGVPYNRMSKKSQADIDAFAPEGRTALEQGFSVDAPVRQLYNNIAANPRKYIIEYKHAKGIKFPPDIAIPNIKLTVPSFDQVIAQLGPIGHAYVQAEVDQRAILQQVSDQQHQEESLLLNQAPTDPPLPPSQGPWTVRVPNSAYIRLVINGGNMQADNLLQIRVLPQSGSYDDARLFRPRLVYTAFQSPIGLSILEMMGAGGLAAGLPAANRTSQFHRQSVTPSASTSTLIGIPSIPSQYLIVVLPLVLGLGPMMMEKAGPPATGIANSQNRTANSESQPCDNLPPCPPQRVMNKPNAVDSTLTGIYDELWRPEDTLPGGTVGALCIEVQQSPAMQKHYLKAKQRLVQITNRLSSWNPPLNKLDRTTANLVQQDLRDAVKAAEAAQQSCK